MIRGQIRIPPIRTSGKALLTLVVTAFCFTVVVPAKAQETKPTSRRAATIIHPAATDIHPAASIPRPEHPRPDLQRDNWLTLNGEWQFENDTVDDGEDRGLIYGKDLNSKIIVPFCPESKLSGIGLGNSQKLKNVWYRRTFEVPAAMNGKRLRLHFGGVDYTAWIYINGQLAGSHTGENAEFSLDIFRFLKNGPNELVIKVVDDMWSGLQPCGKQCFDQSYSCFYTRTTGIWQSVWLEAVGSSFVENISIVPDPDNSRVFIDVKLNGSDKDLSLAAEAFADGKPVGSDKSTGLAPFGQGDERVRTNWSSGDIWLRKTFEYDGGELKIGGVVICHDEDTEVYVNGQKILSVKGFDGNYRLHPVTEVLGKA